MGKRFAIVMKRRIRIAAASLVVAAGLIGAVAATASTPAHTSRPPLVKPNSKRIGSTVPSLAVFGAIDGQGAVTYAFGGEVGLQRRTPLPPIGIHRKGSHPPRGCWSCWSAARTRPVALKCNQHRTVTLFRVEPNGSATRIASTTSRSELGRTGGSPAPWRGPWAKSRATTTRRWPRQSSSTSPSP